MNKMLLCFFMWIAVTPPAIMAQDRGEISVFGGYLHSGPGSFAIGQGWNASLAGNVMKHVALVGDFSGLYKSSKYTYPGYTYNGVTIFASSSNEYRNRYHTFLFGPRLAYTIEKRVTPFVHFLVGVQHYSSNDRDVSGSTINNYSSNGNFFTGAVGVGADIKLNNRVSLRPIQLDAIGVRSSPGYWNFQSRVSFGAVFRLNKNSNY
jgi:hypothetical protein